jgi:hypothetical protein
VTERRTRRRRPANNIVVVPSFQTLYYQNMSEELFIEKDINWVRLRDVTLTYALPDRYLNGARLFVTRDRSRPVDELFRPRPDRERQHGGRRRLGCRGHRLRKLSDAARPERRRQGRVLTMRPFSNRLHIAPASLRCANSKWH